MTETTHVYIARWLSYQRMENGVCFEVESDAGDSAQVQVTLPEPAIVRLRMAPGQLGPPDDRLLDVKGAPPLGSTLSVDEEGVTLSSPQLRVRIERDPWRVSLSDPVAQPPYAPPGPFITQEAVDDRYITGAFQVYPLGWEKAADGTPLRTCEALSLAPDERWFGFGERFVPLDQRGRRWESWATDAHSTASQRAYKPVPFGLSSRGFGLFVNSTARITFDIGATSTLSATFLLDAPVMDYFIIYGPALTDVLRRYWRLTGAPPLPPRWSFGFWSSRNSYRSRQEVEEIAREYRRRGIPCDVIHLDPYWMGDDTHWCDLSWDTEAFPDPVEMMAHLRSLGFRVCLWENPYVPPGTELYAEGAANGYFVRDDQGEPLLIPGWTESRTPLAVVDMTNPEAVAWWQQKHRQLMGMGAATFKTDFGESAPVEGHYHDGTPGAVMHNLYPLLYNQAVFQVVDSQTGGHGIVWARSATAGSQRYPVHWGGDCRTTFGHMAASLRGGLNLILSGFAYWSHDIGGYIHETEPALYARWAQFGLFCSHARAHGTTPREPWHFGEQVEAIFKKYVTLRYRLLPYLYSCAARTVETGRPLMRPMLLDYQDDPTTHTLDLQYLLGEDLLVAPALAPEADVQLYLPKGRWIDYWTKQTFAGPGWTTVHAPLDTLPLFVREGAIIPMGPEMQHTDEKALDPLTLDIYPADEGSFVLLDEATPPVHISYQLTRDTFTLHLDGYRGRVEAVLNLVPPPWDVRVNGRKNDAWEAHARYTLVRFEADGAAEMSLKFDL